MSNAFRCRTCNETGQLLLTPTQKATISNDLGSKEYSVSLYIFFIDANSVEIVGLIIDKVEL